MDTTASASEEASTSTAAQSHQHHQVNQDELIMQQQRRIEQEISESTPLISDLFEISTLDDEYNEDPIYTGKVIDLAKKYKLLRRTRPDGNCFFRAFAFSYLESLIGSISEYDKFKEFSANTKSKLIQLGFPQFTLEDFHDTFMEVLQIVQPTENSKAEENGENVLERLIKVFNDQGYSDYVVVYLRLITSGQLQEGADFYRNFIDGDCTITEFCHQEVEPMYKESDHIHVIALSKALNVGIRIEYMDRGEGAEVIAHNFPDDIKPKIFLLYRPGHYDILYPKSE